MCWVRLAWLVWPSLARYRAPLGLARLSLARLRLDWIGLAALDLDYRGLVQVGSAWLGFWLARGDDALRSAGLGFS